MAIIPVPTSSTIIEDWFNGFYAALVFITVWTIASNKHYMKSTKVALSGFAILMYICSTVHAAVNWSWFSKAVDGNELPGSTGLFDSLRHIPPWQEAVGNTFFALNILFADSLLIWRCWVLWGRRWWIVFVPAIGTLSGIALAIIAIYSVVQSDIAHDPTEVGKQAHRFVSFSTAYFSTSIATSVIATSLIILRILLVQWSNAKFVSSGREGRGNPYRHVIEIVVESAALYSITLLIFIIFLETKNPNLYYAQNVHAQVAGIAPLLIILRVASNSSRPDSEWTSSIQFGRPAVGSTEQTLSFVSTYENASPTNTLECSSSNRSLKREAV
ncbi:hypothetical protein VKT23_015150 [Stygiomarasmius scandens]|uniref:Uncharacterized protein n=1 Tax=Marasmiellus scandens TaxID=2682957 RepID=A0ABR1IYZ3_9AGAR